jgi:hypothetical protein
MSLSALMIRHQARVASSEMLLRLAVRGVVLSAIAWAWITSTLVWFATARYRGPLAHEYFTEWIVAWFFSRAFPVPMISLPYRGRRYPADSIYEFLNRNIFGASPVAWFEDYEFLGLLLLLMGAALVLFAFELPRLEQLRSDAQEFGTEAAHVRGLRLVSARRLDRQLGGTGIAIAGVRIPRSREPEHFLIAGATGTGKSVAIRAILRQAERRRETAVVVDPDREFTPEFFRPERGDVILNPLDTRCPAWKPWDELEAARFEVDAEMLATAFIPDPPGPHGEDGSSFFFRQSSRTLITALLKVAEPTVAGSLLALLNLSRSELKRRLAGTAAEPLIDPGAHDQGAGIIATAANAINPLRYLPDKTEPRWSAREWVDQAHGWIFLTSRDDMATAVMPLLSVWLDCIVRRLLARPAPSGDRARVWIVVDELAALKRQAQLENLLVRGRKRELSAVIGFQTISQLRAIYGREQASVLSSMPSTKLLLRVDEAETAEFLSRQIGEREILRDQLGAHAGETRTTLTLNANHNVEPLVLPSEIQGLQKLSGYLCVAGSDRARVRIPLHAASFRHPAFLPIGRDAAPVARTLAEGIGTSASARNFTFRDHS